MKIGIDAGYSSLFAQSLPKLKFRGYYETFRLFAKAGTSLFVKPGYKRPIENIFLKLRTKAENCTLGLDCRRCLHIELMVHSPALLLQILLL